MKITAGKRKILFSLLISALVALGASACGKGNGPDVVTPVAGTIAFGNQCPYGSISNLKGSKVELMDCPLGLSKLELSQNPQPIFLVADCKKMLITARTADRTLDTSWEVMPDGNFSFTLDGLGTRVKNDGLGTSNCVADLSVDFWGKLQCLDRDRVTIKVESVWWMGKKSDSSTSSNSASSAASSSPAIPPYAHSNPGPMNNRPTPLEGPRCKFPPSCYLHSQTSVNQCQ